MEDIKNRMDRAERMTFDLYVAGILQDAYGNRTWFGLGRRAIRSYHDMAIDALKTAGHEDLVERVENGEYMVVAREILEKNRKELGD